MTVALESGVEARQADGWKLDLKSADSTLRPELLARHIYTITRHVLETIPGEGEAQATEQVALANRLIEPHPYRTSRWIGMERPR